MHTFNRIVPVLLLGLLFSASVQASEGSIRIISPADGATVDSSAEKFHVFYHATFDPKGDHIHLSVDGKDKETLRQLQVSHVTDVYEKDRWVPVMREINGKTAIDPLSPGKHEICAKVVNKLHVPIGVKTCIHVVSK
ncbi:MAG: hypothetical protein ACYCZR_01240 [Burkholderiales bacterium]